MLLEIKGLIIARGPNHLLHFPDLTIEAGKSALLLGASGCGKTSFLSCIAGLLPPQKGEVLIDGQNLYALEKVGRDKLRGQTLGFVFQTMHLLPSLTVLENITLAAKMARVPLDISYRQTLMESLGIAHLARRKPREISQGEQQRVALARALINRPKIILADEPTSALDDDNAQAVINLLVNHSRQAGAALLVATHDHRITQGFETIINLSNQKAENAA